METALHLLRVFHVVGHVLWLGAGCVIAFLAAGAVADPPEVRRVVFPRLSRLAARVVNPGLGLAFLTGLALLVLGWTEIYSKQPWAHTKLTLGIVAAGLTGVMISRLKKQSAGLRETRAVLYRFVGWSLAATALVNALLVYLRPGPG